LFRVVGIRAVVLFVVYGGQELGSRERRGLSYLSCSDVCWELQVWLNEMWGYSPNYLCQHIIDLWRERKLCRS